MTTSDDTAPTAADPKTGASMNNPAPRFANAAEWSDDDFEVGRAASIAHPPVEDWTTDFDHTITEYAQNAPDIWDEFREKCPVAHTERFGGAWFPSRHEDVSAIAHDTDNFSSRGIIVNDMGFRGEAPVGYAPPITSDPPFHHIARKLLLGPFSPKSVAALEPAARATCRSLIRETIESAVGKWRSGRCSPVLFAAHSRSCHRPDARTPGDRR